MLENKPLATSWNFSNQHAWIGTPNGHQAFFHQLLWP